MSEKRFVYGRSFAINSDDSLPCITDSEKDMDYFRMSDVCNVLNEQQNSIQSLQDLCGKSDYENAKLRIENKQLRQILKDIVASTDETYMKNKSIYKVTVIFDNKEYLKIRECLNE